MSIFNEAKFNTEPGVKLKRTTFKTRPTQYTTFVGGRIIPIFVKECLPGSNYKVDVKSLVRMPTLLFPFSTPLYMDIHAFYVPMNQVDKNFEKMIGEGHDNNYSMDKFGKSGTLPNPESIGKGNEPTLFTPKMRFTKDDSEHYTVTAGDLINYFNIDVGTNLQNEDNICAYPFRAYNLIYNNYYRSPFLQDPIPVDYGESESDISNFHIRKACKLLDWFNSCTISAGLNDTVIDLEGNVDIDVPEHYGDVGQRDYSEKDKFFKLQHDIQSATVSGELKFNREVFDLKADDDYNDYYDVRHNVINTAHDISLGSVTPWYSLSGSQLTARGIDTNVVARIQASKLYGQLTSSMLRVQDLRNAYILDRYNEKMMFGTDYRSFLQSFFGVNLHTYLLDKPLYVGGYRQRIMTEEVTQTGGDSTALTPIGSTYGKSVTAYAGNSSTVSFASPVHGLLMILAVVRQDNIQMNSLSPLLGKHDKYDFYLDIFNGVGSVPLQRKYIFFSGDKTIDNETFGFNEYYSEGRYDVSHANGYYSRNTGESSLANEILADQYDKPPYLDSTFIQSNCEEVLNNVIAIESEKVHQFKAMFVFDYSKTVPVPAYSIAGLTRL